MLGSDDVELLVMCLSAHALESDPNSCPEAVRHRDPVVRKLIPGQCDLCSLTTGNCHVSF